MSKTNGTRRAWTSEQVRTLKTLVSKEDACWKDCSRVEEDGGRNAAKGFQPRIVFAIALLKSN
jgi:hypothetical protein